MKLTLARKLHSAFGAVILMLVVSGVLVWHLKDLADRNLERGQRRTSATAALADAQSALWALRWGVAQFVAVTDPAVRAKITDDAPKLRADLERAIAGFEAGIDSAEERRLSAELRDHVGRYTSSRSKWLQLMNDGNTAEAAKERAEVTTPAGGATVKSIASLIERQRKDGAEAAQKERAELARWSVGLVAFMLGVAVAACLAVVRIVRSITRPLQDAVRVARCVAEGDLTARIELHGRDETGELMSALKAMNAGLARLVMSVRASSDSIATGSAQIAGGNANLSQRTEAQASSLQQAAASIEELNATVRNSAETARQATQLASSASDAACKGGEVVSQVVATMSDISSSSRRIADIIGVIDSIAFQTNILALNAAVEAARAGEGGRGFAVVAGEVRSLAQRSAEAAKEIKSLIGSSVERVEAGSRLVGEAGSAMDELVGQVKRVADLIREISAAAAEQTSGIGQIGNAVVQLDQATQQNAALVEESAAAAGSLKQQADSLVAAVGVFRVDQGARS